jgi:hypothetical protein
MARQVTAEQDAAVQVVAELAMRRDRILYESVQERDGRLVDRSAWPAEDAGPDAYRRLTGTLARAVAAALDTGVSRTMLYNSTSLSRNDIDWLREQGQADPVESPRRANELASRTTLWTLATATAHDLAEMFVAGDEAGAERLRRKTLAFINERLAAIGRHEEDPNRLAVVDVIVHHVHRVLSPASIEENVASRRRWSPVTPRRLEL